MIKEIEEATPLVANFIRGFMEHVQEDNSLRRSGEAGVEAAELAGIYMSPKTPSNITKNMVKWGVIKKVRNGKHFIVQPGELYEELIEWLQDPPEDWGKTKSEKDLPDRLAAIRAVQEGTGVVFDSEDERIPRGGWAILTNEFKGGRLKSAYVPKNATLFMVWRDEDGNKQKAKVPTWSQISENS